VDLAIDMLDSIQQFLRQRVADGSSVEKARADLAQLRAKCIQRIQTSTTAPPQEGAR
jgi:hypothetical protein